MIGVDGNIRIGEKDFVSGASLAHIVQCLDERIGRREPLAPELPIDPLEEDIDERLTVSQSMQLLGLASELELANVFLDREQRL